MLTLLEIELKERAPLEAVSFWVTILSRGTARSKQQLHYQPQKLNIYLLLDVALR